MHHHGERGLVMVTEHLGFESLLENGEVAFLDIALR
jgi:hypothetical protein